MPSVASVVYNDVNIFIMLYDVMWYLFTEIGFTPGGSGRWNYTQIENKQLYIGEKQYTQKNTETENTQNRKQTYKTRKQTYKNINP